MGSDGDTLTSMDCNTRLTASDATKPTIRPIPRGIIPCRNTRANDVLRGCADRHPDAQFLSSLGHGIRDYRVEADRCQKERDHGED